MSLHAAAPAGVHPAVRSVFALNWRSSPVTSSDRLEKHWGIAANPDGVFTPERSVVWNASPHQKPVQTATFDIADTNGFILPNMFFVFWMRVIVSLFPPALMMFFCCPPRMNFEDTFVFAASLGHPLLQMRSLQLKLPVKLRGEASNADKWMDLARIRLD